jgi:FemAB-related protein (PEP-CTERM system-associated)
VQHERKEVALQPPRARPQVGQLAPADAARWDAFVESCPTGTYFHRAGWKTVLENVFGYRTLYLYAERGGQIVGVLPLAQVKSWLFGHALVSLPFCVYGGVAVHDPQAAPLLIAEAERFAERLGAQRLELRHCAALNPAWPRQELYVTFRRPILPEVEANMLAIPRKQRAMVRKGVSAGLRSGSTPTSIASFALRGQRTPARHPASAETVFRSLQHASGPL